MTAKPCYPDHLTLSSYSSEFDRSLDPLLLLWRIWSSTFLGTNILVFIGRINHCTFIHIALVPLQSHTPSTHQWLPNASADMPPLKSGNWPAPHDIRWCRNVIYNELPCHKCYPECLLLSHLTRSLIQRKPVQIFLTPGKSPTKPFVPDPPQPRLFQTCPYLPHLHC